MLQYFWVDSVSCLKQKLYRIIPSFRRTIARSQGQSPVMKIRTCAIQRRTKHNGKARNKIPRGREQHHVNGYMLGCLREQAKWLTGVPNMATTWILYLRKEAVLWKTPRYKSSDYSVEAIHVPNMAATWILYLHKEAVLWKTPRYKSSDYSIEAIRGSSWPIHSCLKKSNRTHTHTHTQLL